MNKTSTQKISIQERMRLKALNALDPVELEIDKVMDRKKNPFSMYKYLRQLGYSSRVVQYMKGWTHDTQYEIKNEEGCEQLEEAYSFLNKTQKKYALKFLDGIEKDIEKYCDEYKPVRKPRIKTPAQVVKKITYLDEWKKYKSIDPVEIPRARMLFTYNTSSKKLTKFEGHLSARGSRITGYDECVEKTLTDLSLLDRLVSGGNIIAQKFMDEIPRSKLKEGNDRITKNIILVKVVK
jgi:hypothetical protein